MLLNTDTCTSLINSSTIKRFLNKLERWKPKRTQNCLHEIYKLLLQPQLIRTLRVFEGNGWMIQIWKQHKIVKVTSFSTLSNLLFQPAMYSCSKNENSNVINIRVWKEPLMRTINIHFSFPKWIYEGQAYSFLFLCGLLICDIKCPNSRKHLLLRMNIFLFLSKTCKPCKQPRVT
jgi:hypothetical protein